MALQRYLVFSILGQWRIALNGRYLSLYNTEAEALRAAIGQAHASGVDGHDVKVRVQGFDRQIRTAWTYGEDSLPPSV